IAAALPASKQPRSKEQTAADSYFLRCRPMRAVLAAHIEVRFRVADHSLAFRVEPQIAAGARHDIRQVAVDDRDVAGADVSARQGTRTHRLNEILLVHLR